jgi:hypothetical protein
MKISKSPLALPSDVRSAPPLMYDANGIARPRSDNCKPVNVSMLSRSKPKPPSLTGLRAHTGNANNQPTGLLKDPKYPHNKPYIPKPDSYFRSLNTSVPSN